MWMAAAYRRTHSPSRYSIGLVWGLAVIWLPVYIHQMNGANSRNGFGRHDSSIKIVVVLLLSLLFSDPGTQFSGNG